MHDWKIISLESNFLHKYKIVFCIPPLKKTKIFWIRFIGRVQDILDKFALACIWKGEKRGKRQAIHNAYG